MRKLILAACFMISFATVGTSQLHFGAGAQLIFDGSVFGVQGKALYDFNETWSGAGTFTFHLEDGIDFTLDFDAMYKLLDVSDNFNLAPVAGLSITKYGAFGFSGTETGLNLGAFITFGAGDSMTVYIEPKFNIGGYESLSVSGGLLF